MKYSIETVGRTKQKYDPKSKVKGKPRKLQRGYDKLISFENGLKVRVLKAAFGFAYSKFPNGTKTAKPYKFMITYLVNENTPPKSFGTDVKELRLKDLLYLLHLRQLLDIQDFGLKFCEVCDGTGFTKLITDSPFCSSCGGDPIIKIR